MDVLKFKNYLSDAQHALMDATTAIDNGDSNNARKALEGQLEAVQRALDELAK